MNNSSRPQSGQGLRPENSGSTICHRSGRPGINFIFAAIVYALIVWWVEKAIPVVGELPSQTAVKTQLPAEIVSFDGRQMISWERISIAMVDVIGDKTTVQVGLRPLDSSVVNKVTIPVPKS